MAIKVIEQTISVERKKHPNEVRYPCRSTNELLEAVRRLLNNLPPEEYKNVINNDLILEEEDTAELFDSFKENDVIGLAVVRPNGLYSNLYRIEKIYSDEDWMTCKNFLTKEIEEISFQDVSVGLALGFAEILYRDDKPFGVSSHYDFTIQIEYDSEDKDKVSSDIKKENADEATEENRGTLERSDETSEGSLENTERNERNEKIEGVQKVHNNLGKSSIKFKDFYYAFGFDNDLMIDYIIITPATLWDKEKRICNMSSADHLAEKLDLDRLTESTYEYTQKYSQTQLRQMLNAFKAKENNDLLK